MLLAVTSFEGASRQSPSDSVEAPMALFKHDDEHLFSQPDLVAPFQAGDGHGVEFRGNFG